MGCGSSTEQRSSYRNDLPRQLNPRQAPDRRTTRPSPRNNRPTQNQGSERGREIRDNHRGPPRSSSASPRSDWAPREYQGSIPLPKYRNSSRVFSGQDTNTRISTARNTNLSPARREERDNRQNTQRRGKGLLAQQLRRDDAERNEQSYDNEESHSESEEHGEEEVNDDEEIDEPGVKGKGLARGYHERSER